MTSEESNEPSNPKPAIEPEPPSAIPRTPDTDSHRLAPFARSRFGLTQEPLRDRIGQQPLDEADCGGKLWRKSEITGAWARDTGQCGLLALSRLRY